MTGKIIFRPKKLLGLLSFAAICFVAVEIWLSHKKIDNLDAGRAKKKNDKESPEEKVLSLKAPGGKSGGKLSEEGYDFYAAADDSSNRSNNLDSYETADQTIRRNNNGQDGGGRGGGGSRRGAKVGATNNHKNRTDFKGGGHSEVTSPGGGGDDDGRNNDGGGDDNRYVQGNDDDDGIKEGTEKVVKVQADGSEVKKEGGAGEVGVADDDDVGVFERDGEDDNTIGGGNHGVQVHPQAAPMFEETSHILCNINGDYLIDCLRDERNVYVPFSFIKKYFEIYGEMSTNKDGLEELLWKHSYAKAYEVGASNESGTYRHDGVFMSFQNYNVETRDRVKCVSAIEGVPVSIQWGAHGYFYPIQIAQFGLSHYSKMLVEPERKFQVLGAVQGDWLYFDTTRVKEGMEKYDGLKVIATNSESPEGQKTDVEVVFNVSKSLDPDIFYYLNIPDEISTLEPSSPPYSTSTNFNFLSFDMTFSTNASVTLTFETNLGDVYKITYLASDVTITTNDQDVYYGIGTRQGWHRLTRDIHTDFQKSLPQKLRKKLYSRYFPLHLSRLELRGCGSLRNLQLANKDHLSLFYHSADWLVKHQDAKGGWPIPVGRDLVEGSMTLKPGWYSAMAQGHAMSLLSRAYSRSKNPVYLRSAYQGINPFLIPSSEGGVLAYLFDRHPWYEEYPTDPPSFVVNGFMYALFGLYDLAETLEPLDDSVPLEDGFVLGDDVWLKTLDDHVAQKAVVNKNTAGDSKGVDNNDRVSNELVDEQFRIDSSLPLRNKRELNSIDVTQPFHDPPQSSRGRRKKDSLKSKRIRKRYNTLNRIASRGSSSSNLSLPLPVASPVEMKKDFIDGSDRSAFQRLSRENVLIDSKKNNFSSQPTPTPPGPNGSFEQQSSTGARSEVVYGENIHDLLQQPAVTKHLDEEALLPAAKAIIPALKNIRTARQLFEAGFSTLKVALPLFDAGSGSFYDLRHFSLPGHAPNLARWDYHTTHISQLYMALAIETDPAGRKLFSRTIKRWLSYMKGKKAPHN